MTENAPFERFVQRIAVAALNAQQTYVRNLLWDAHAQHFSDCTVVSVETVRLKMKTAPAVTLGEKQQVNKLIVEASQHPIVIFLEWADGKGAGGVGYRFGFERDEYEIILITQK